MPPIYLDNAATTPVDPRVADAVRPLLAEEFGNPSSRHPPGVRAAEALDLARRRVARALGADPERVTFTSGGTEANNLAVLGLARAARSEGRHVLVGATEHASVRASALALRDEGFEVEFLRLDAAGDLDEEDLARRLRPDTVLVSQMRANNEFGTVFPVARVARAVRARSPVARLHADCVQGLGKLECSPADLGVDCISVSGHKVHGPKGVGALVFAEARPLRPLTFGGGQEDARRPGTENLPGIVGFGVACELAEERREQAVAAMAACRAALLERIAGIAGLQPFEPGSERLPSILALRVAWAPAEVVMHHLEVHGVYVSSGSACQARNAQASPAALALGLTSHDAKRMLRISFSGSSTPEQARLAGEALEAVGRELQAVAR